MANGRNKKRGLFSRFGRGDQYLDDDGEDDNQDDYEQDQEQQEYTRCICGNSDDEGVMIQCEKCLAWQHVVCMGLNPEYLPETYYCELCQPQDHPVNHRKRRGGSPETSADIKKSKKRTTFNSIISETPREEKAEEKKTPEAKETVEPKRKKKKGIRDAASPSEEEINGKNSPAPRDLKEPKIKDEDTKEDTKEDSKEDPKEKEKEKEKETEKEEELEDKNLVLSPSARASSPLPSSSTANVPTVAAIINETSMDQTIPSVTTNEKNTSPSLINSSSSTALTSPTLSATSNPQQQPLVPEKPSNSPNSVSESPTNAPTSPSPSNSSLSSHQSNAKGQKGKKVQKPASVKSMLKRAQAMMDYLAYSKQEMLKIYPEQMPEDFELLQLISKLESKVTLFQKTFSPLTEKRAIQT